MSEVHTIVVRFPEGASPSYSSDTEFQGGSVRAIDRDGNRLTVEHELLSALEDLLMRCESDLCAPEELHEVKKARAAIHLATK